MKYHNPDSYASQPGGIILSDSKLALLHPELYSSTRWIIELARNGSMYPVKDRKHWRESIAEHLLYGDSRAAVVVSSQPSVVAAYSDELDCVALLSFSEKITAPYGWRTGTRLLTVNTYTSLDQGAATDLSFGPNHLGQYGNFMPYVADLLTDDAATLELRKREISEEEWSLTARLGDDALAAGDTRPRDGRPLRCFFPAA